MLIEIKKQATETLEVNTPCYFKENYGSRCHINTSGQLIKVNKDSIIVWNQSDSEHYQNAIQRALEDSTPITKEAFDKAYAEAIDNANAAVGAVVI